jgi:hypothetical protein
MFSMTFSAIAVVASLISSGTDGFDFLGGRFIQTFRAFGIVVQ